MVDHPGYETVASSQEAYFQHGCKGSCAYALASIDELLYQADSSLQKAEAQGDHQGMEHTGLRCMDENLDLRLNMVAALIRRVESSIQEYWGLYNLCFYHYLPEINTISSAF